jgi:hypothetical protein
VRVHNLDIIKRVNLLIENFLDKIIKVWYNIITIKVKKKTDKKENDIMKMFALFQYTDDGKEFKGIFTDKRSICNNLARYYVGLAEQGDIVDEFCYKELCYKAMGENDESLLDMLMNRYFDFIFNKCFSEFDEGWFLADYEAETIETDELYNI